MTKKKLVVIGGGSAGHRIAYLMQRSLDVTMVEPKAYFEVPMALPRLLAEPGALPAHMVYREFLPLVRHVQGKAMAISSHHLDVDTADGTERIDFDFAVVATGSRYVDPLIKAEALTVNKRRAQIAQAHEQLKQARSVVVAGGGPVGVEIAAELAEAFPHLDVTLLHKDAKLLKSAPSRFGDWALQALEKKDVRVLLDDALAEPAVGLQPEQGHVQTRSGKTLQADLVMWAAGIRPNTGFLTSSWPELVQADGLLKTDRYLRLQDRPNIFVAGDVTNLPEGRLTLIASLHVKSIVTNLTKMLSSRGFTDDDLEPYQPSLPGKGMGKMMIVTLGRRAGLTSLPFGQFRLSAIARMIKSENMFVKNYRKDVGLA